MRRSVALLLASCILSAQIPVKHRQVIGVSAPPPTIALVQHKTEANINPAAMPLATTTGNAMIIGFEVNGGITVTSVTDDSPTGANWVNVGRIQNSSNQYVELWYCPNITGFGSGGHGPTLTFTFSGSPGYFVYYWQEWSGLATSPLDTTAQTASGPSSPATVGPFTVTNGDLVMAIATAPTAGSGFTQIDSDGFSIAEYQIASSTSATATATGGSPWAIISAGFK